MILGIDASNLRTGGGVTHLVELLRAAQPRQHGFSRVVVWGGARTLAQIDPQPWLVKSTQVLLNRALPYRLFWQHFRLAKLARATGCTILFAPGGSVTNDFHPVVTMCRNLLPFEWRELRRYGYSWLTVKGLILRFVQARAFQRANGLIFLTRYARNTVLRVAPVTDGNTVTFIPHGISARFARQPRPQLDISQYSAERPFRLLYVSMIDMYKHHWHVVEAVGSLRSAGLPIALELIGPAYRPALARLMQTLARVDRAGEFVHYAGAVPHAELHARYAAADLCLFASSCENMPNILLEAMASGLPIACSDRGPMPEVLDNAGVYFDPENPAEIAGALRALIADPRRRETLSEAAFRRAQAWSWRRCADETFEFLAATAAHQVQGLCLSRDPEGRSSR